MKMKALNIAIELSDLFEQAGAEGGLVAQLLDEEIMPLVRTGLNEKADAIGLGDRFNRVLEKVRLSVGSSGRDRVRTLKDMLRSALSTYVRHTNDAVTARGAFHHSIKSGSDMMLAVAAAAILANALCGSHSKEAQSLMQKVASKLTGKQDHIPALEENASGAASGSGSIATVAGKKKKRKDSIFAEGEVIPFPGKLKADPKTLYGRISQRLAPFAEARRIAEQLGWKYTDHYPITHGITASIHRDPSGSGIPLWVLSDGSWHHMGTRGMGPQTLHEYLKQHTVMGETMINEGDVLQFPGAAQPVQNPELSQAADVSNLHMMRPEARPMSNMFYVILYTPREGEQEFDADLADLKELTKTLGISKYDRANRMFYAPGNSAANVATLHVYHQNHSELSPVEAGRVNMEIQQYLQAHMRENLNWDDLLGEPSAMEVLHEVARSGTARRHAGVLVDPTTAELVLSVHRSLTPENRQHYQIKPLARMIAIAERAVQRGLIGVSIEEA